MMSDDIKRLIIYGAGGLGREVLVLMRRARSDAKILGFADDSVEKGTIRNDAEVIGGFDYFDTLKEPTGVILAIADPHIKEKLYSQLKSNPFISFPKFIHPTSNIEPYAEVSEGVLMTRNNHVSIDTKIGRCVLLNGSTAIGHDTVIGDFTTVMPMAAISGNVTIGRGCLIGVSSAIIQGVKIGDGATIGMGSVVIRDVPPGASVFGNPAKRIS